MRVTDEMVFAAADSYYAAKDDASHEDAIRAALETALSHAAGQEADDSLPAALLPVSDEWYRLCERRFAVDKITISGELAEAIVEAMRAPATTTNPAEIGRKSVGGEAVAWTDEQCVQFASIAFRHARRNLPKGVTLDDIRMASARVNTHAHPPASAEVGRDAVMAWPEGWKIEHTDNAKWPLRITEPHGINAWEMDAGNLACRFLIAAMAASSGRKAGN